jgi:hypothetical protein
MSGHWEHLGTLLTPLDDGPTDAERERAVAHWENDVRPHLKHEKPYGPFEPPEMKLERLERIGWPKPVIGKELRAYLDTCAEQLRRKSA